MGCRFPLRRDHRPHSPPKFPMKSPGLSSPAPCYPRTTPMPQTGPTQPTNPPPVHPRPDLPRVLGVSQATAIVVGTIIGSGIFLVPSEMMADLGSSGLVYLAWIVGGLLSLFGAMTYAELGAILPYAGGEYVYLRGAYGDTTAFLYMWTWFAVAKPASIAAVTIGLTRTLGFFPAFHWLSSQALGAPHFILWSPARRHRRHLVHHRTQLPRHQKSRRLPTRLHHPQSRSHPHRRWLLLHLRRRLLVQLFIHTAPRQRRIPVSCSPSSPPSGPMTDGTT